MVKCVIYCSVKFLEKLFYQIDKNISDWLTNDNKYTEIYKLLHSTDIELITDENILIASQINPNFKKLLKAVNPKASDGSFNFEQIINKSFITRLDSEPTIFLIENSSEKEYLEGLGYIAITLEGLERETIIFCNDPITISKNQKNDWHFIAKYKHSFNSLIIHDPYILSTSNGFINLSQFLINFLPEKLTTELDLTIISNRNDRGLPSDICQIRDTLKSDLNIFPYDINISVILSNIHDRNIITNHVVISSGYGFEIIKNGINIKDTVIRVESTTDSGTRNVLEKLKQISKNALSKTVDIGLLKNVAGNRKNRMLGGA